MGIETILLSVLVVGVAFALIATRMLLVKDGEFRGTCSTNNPFLKSSMDPCPVCGREPGEECQFEQVTAGAGGT